MSDSVEGSEIKNEIRNDVFSDETVASTFVEKIEDYIVSIK